MILCLFVFLIWGQRGFQKSISSLRLEVAEQLGFVFFLTLYFHEFSLLLMGQECLVLHCMCVTLCVHMCWHALLCEMGCFRVYVCTHDFLPGSCHALRWLQSPSSQRGLCLSASSSGMWGRVGVMIPWPQGFSGTVLGTFSYKQGRGSGRVKARDVQILGLSKLMGAQEWF